MGRQFGYNRRPSIKLHVCRLCMHVKYRGADKSLARPTSRYIFFDDENISFDASLVIYINSTNIPPIMMIRIYETQNLLSL
jgi:homoserine trans-succinylase